MLILSFCLSMGSDMVKNWCIERGGDGKGEAFGRYNKVKGR